MRALGWGLDSLPRIARGEGSYLYDTTGRRYLDGSGGPAAFGIGHDNPEVNATIASQRAGRMRIPAWANSTRARKSSSKGVS